MTDLGASRQPDRRGRMPSAAAIGAVVVGGARRLRCWRRPPRVSPATRAAISASDVAGLFRPLGRPGRRGRRRRSRRIAATDLAAELARSYGGRFELCDFGFSIRLVDAPIGIVAGLIAQFAIVPLFELPLLPFVPHLFNRLGGPAPPQVDHVNGPGLLFLGTLHLCRESVRRGAVLPRPLAAGCRSGSAAGATRLLVPGVARGRERDRRCSALRALSRLLQLLGLDRRRPRVRSARGLRTGRLGPGIVAHATFNAVTVIALSRTH